MTNEIENDIKFVKHYVGCPFNTKSCLNLSLNYLQIKISSHDFSASSIYLYLRFISFKNNQTVIQTSIVNLSSLKCLLSIHFPMIVSAKVTQVRNIIQRSLSRKISFCAH